MRRSRPCPSAPAPTGHSAFPSLPAPLRLLALALGLMAAITAAHSSTSAEPALPPASTTRPFAVHTALTPRLGQIEFVENERPVLQYNFHTVEPGPFLDKVSAANRIYARPRGDYIHPLYGLHGECLTRDWSPDHPHHRGIYWAWPEVEFGSERGDLHALQHVFARPEGTVATRNGTNFAELTAVNLWRWEDQKPIVRETLVLRSWPTQGRGRAIDLELTLVALADGVTLARRETRLYGGLSPRLATPTNQSVATHTDPPAHSPRRAWSDLSGSFSPGHDAGLTILQHAGNPEYPGDWIQYPELSWCQPTFPSAGTRFPLRQDRPLVLRYRLWVHDGLPPSETEAAKLWDDYQAFRPSPVIPAPAPAHSTAP